MDKTSLGDRMKGYERVPQSTLMARMPVIIRLDGKAFHTYTKGVEPFSEEMHAVRAHTMRRLCEDVQGCIIGYAQSDEISLVLKDWQTFSSQAWFGKNVQKICSVSASMCTQIWNSSVDTLPPKAIFDSRCFNLPKEEVVNYLIWRQQDWERNSIQMLAQQFYSHKQLHKKNQKEMVAMIEVERGIIWGNLQSWKKRGEFWIDGILYEETPIFKDFRPIIESLLDAAEE